MQKRGYLSYLWLLVLLAPVAAALILMRETAFRFEHRTYLWGLGVIIPLQLVFVWYQIWRARKIRQIGDMRLVERLMPDYSHQMPLLKFILAVLALEFIILGFANPQIGSKQEKVKRQGIDVVVAMDVSNSMLSEDEVKISRLARTKNFVSNFIDKLHNDRLGMVVFAGRAYLQMPLTVDYSAARMYLKTVNTNLIPSQGTNLGEAINLAKQSFVQEETEHKALIIISDGEDNEGGTEEAIAEARKAGIKIFTIGVGSDKGSPIPMGNGDYKRDEEGNIVLSKMNEQMLQEVANKGGGKYYTMRNGDAEIQDILNELGGIGGKAIEDVVFTDFDDRFQWCLAAAALLLLVEWFISERRFKLQFKFN